MQANDYKYQQRLLQFAQELEGAGKRKSKAKEKLYQAGQQVKTTLHAINDLHRAQKLHIPDGTNSLSAISPLLEALNGQCAMIEQLIIATLHPHRDQTLKVKCFKKEHNFEKFRKETRELISKGVADINI